MNDVVFVMANSRLAKKKKGRRTPEMKFDGLGSDDDWVMVLWMKVQKMVALKFWMETSYK